MIVAERAAVVRACEVDRKKDYIYVKVIISTAWEEQGGRGPYQPRDCVLIHDI